MKRGGAFVQWLLFSAATTSLVDSSMIVSESKGRLPMSLSTVISDLEAEGMTELSTACFLSSLTVTKAEKRAFLKGMIGDTEEQEDDEGDEASSDDLLRSKAIATAKGLALCQPSAAAMDEVVQSACACQGCVIYLPSVTDLKRGEGLWHTLAPAAERLLHRQKKTNNKDKACLVVVCDSDFGVEETKSKLEGNAKEMLECLTTHKPTTSSSTSTGNGLTQLEDIFGKVLYLTADQVEGALSKDSSPEDAMALVASIVAEDSSIASLMATPNPLVKKMDQNPTEVAAARRFYIAKGMAQEAVMQVVNDATNNSTKLVPAFGSLCDAALAQAQERYKEAAPHLLQTAVGKALANDMAQDLAFDFLDMYEQQLKLLEEASFATMRQTMSKLRLGATLAHDMQEVVKDTVNTFGTQVKSLIPAKVANGGLFKMRASDTKTAFAKKLQEYIQDRLKAAEASGQFKPVPRKGVTIGMHWLLPKPFGNDYRQEPWMVHATDNLDYVPRRKTKVTDIPEEAVKSGSGDWRDQVVPSPAGRDMLYMQ